MGKNLWTGNAVAVAQVVTVQVTAYDASTTYSVTIAGKRVGVAGDPDADTPGAALGGAPAASPTRDFKKAPWPVPTDPTPGTATTAGVPFTATSSVSGGTGT